MSRGRVEERASKVYQFLKENLNTPFTIDDLMKRTRLRDGSTTRAAIKRARDLAQQDGLCFPIACWDNGNTYCVTDIPQAAIDPAIHLGKIAQGVGVRKDVHDDFIRARMNKLTPGERAMFHSLEHFEKAQRETREAYVSVLNAVSKMRREGGDET